jgi:hypothetical protein
MTTDVAPTFPPRDLFPRSEEALIAIALRHGIDITPT